jgi:hypothetical protein
VVSRCPDFQDTRNQGFEDSYQGFRVLRFLKNKDSEDSRNQGFEDFSLPRF